VLLERKQHTKTMNNGYWRAAIDIVHFAMKKTKRRGKQHFPRCNSQISRGYEIIEKKVIMYCSTLSADN